MRLARCRHKHQLLLTCRLQEVTTLEETKQGLQDSVEQMSQQHGKLLQQLQVSTQVDMTPHAGAFSETSTVLVMTSRVPMTVHGMLPKKMLFPSQDSNGLVDKLNETCRSQVQQLEKLRCDMSSRQALSLQQHEQHQQQLQQQVTGFAATQCPMVSKALKSTSHMSWL